MQKQASETESPESISMNNFTQDKLAFYTPANSVENSMVFLQKIKNRTTIRSHNRTTGYVFEGNEISISKR